MHARIALLPGDGIGPEVTAAAHAVLAEVAQEGGHHFDFVEAPIGGGAIDELGDPLPASTLDLCRHSDAALLGAVGGPKWSDPSLAVRPEQGLLRLRQELALFANLRPVPIFPALARSTPLKRELLADVDILVVRELTGGLYFGARREQGSDDFAFDTLHYTEQEVERVAHIAFQAARERRSHVTSVDKANVLAAMRLWRKVVDRVAGEYPEVTCRHMLVDACAMELLRAPSSFDVVLAGNLFGDILSDEAAILSGSLGILPSASLGAGRFGLYEPVHGSAPDIAGQKKANPLGAILSAAMLLRHSLGLEDAALRVECAVATALSEGLWTADLAGEGDPWLTTQELTEAVVERLDCPALLTV